MKQEIRVIAIPTKNAQVLKGQIYNNGGNWGINVATQEEWSDFIPYHLYATTTKSIKEGDWAIRIFDEILFKVNSQSDHDHYECRKVVATTDRSLDLTDEDGKYIVYTTLFPLISPVFQQAWVRKMNNRTPIVEAMMEMKQFYVEGNYTNTCAICKEIFHNTDKKGFICSKCGLQPKLNSEGYVTILLIKEKMYTKEEVKNYCLAAWFHKDLIGGLPFDYTDGAFNSWSKKNL